MALLHARNDEAVETTTTDTVSGPAEERGVVVRRNSFGQTLRTVVATVLLGAVVAIAFANTDRVDVDLLFDTVDAALWAVVAVAAGAGFVIGALFGRGRARRRVS